MSVQLFQLGSQEPLSWQPPFYLSEEDKAFYRKGPSEEELMAKIDTDFGQPLLALLPKLEEANLQRKEKLEENGWKAEYMWCVSIGLVICQIATSVFESQVNPLCCLGAFVGGIGGVYYQDHCWDAENRDCFLEYSPELEKNIKALNDYKNLDDLRGILKKHVGWGLDSPLHQRLCILHSFLRPNGKKRKEFDLGYDVDLAHLTRIALKAARQWQELQEGVQLSS